MSSEQTPAHSRAQQWLCLLLVLSVAACSDGDDAEVVSGGAAGNGGAAGSGGAAASGGAAGNTAGGASGSSAGGSSAGGACNGAVGCSLTLLCEAVGCSTPTSRWDAQGCERAVCEADSECQAGETCVVQSQLSAACTPSLVEGCAEEAGQCACSVSADCHPGGLCMALADAPTERCPVPDSCEELEGKLARLEDSAARLEGALQVAAAECLKQHRERAAGLSCGG